MAATGKKYNRGAALSTVLADSKGNLAPGTAIRGTQLEMGDGASSTAANAVAIGGGVTNAVANTVKVGTNSTTMLHIGDKGTVTQTVSNGQGVTLNAWAGKVTMFTTIPGVTNERFELANSFITTSSVILVSVLRNVSTPDPLDPLTVEVENVVNGIATIGVRNNHGSTATSVPPVICFLVL